MPHTAQARPTVHVGATGAHLEYRADVDGLRALAIVPVLLFHLGVRGFSGGYVGVDVFFVISGYLISSIIYREIQAGRFSFGHFYERRARRLFPSLFIITLATLAGSFLLMLPEDYRSFSQSLAATSVFAANVLFWRTAGYFDGPAEMKPLLHTWSLSVEEQFYILFPVFLLVAHRFVRGRLLLAVTVVAV